MKLIVLLMAGTALATATPAMADEASLKTQIAELKAQLAAQADLLARLEAKTDEISEQQTSTAQTSTALIAAQTSPIPASDSGPQTTIGGYGEIIYNGYLKDRSRNQADLRRVVLFVGHKFNDKLSLVTETEIEHAVTSGGGDPGEVALEQAYINYRFNPALNVKAGLFLLPFGFTNRYHEPTAFYGANRNEVETRIIPSTLREGGISVYGSFDSGISYDVGVTTGYNVAKFEKPQAPLAGVHQELAEANAADLSFYGLLEYKGIAGLTIGGAISTQANSTQANAAFRSDPAQPDLSGIKSRITLFDVHARYQFAGLDLKALYARGTISNAGRINQAYFAANAADGGSRPVVPSAFDGWLVEGAYTVGLGGEMTLSPFARYEQYNTQARLPLGLTADPANRDKVLTTGLSLKPIPEIVLKADYQKYFDNSENDRINLGIGYNF